MAATYNLISSQVLATSAASVTFSSIPQTYTDLVVKISARTNYSSNLDELKTVINNDTSIAYSDTYLFSSGSGAVSGTDSGTGNFASTYLNGSTTATNIFSTTEIYIPMYTTTQTKQMSFFSAPEDNATSIRLFINASLYRGTSAITNITFSSNQSANFVAGSSFYLYGIKNS
jgi:hypothetical protein